jgi:hypothetical protein
VWTIMSKNLSSRLKKKKILIFLPNKLHEHQAPLSSVGAGADRSRQLSTLPFLLRRADTNMLLRINLHSLFLRVINS